MTPHNLEQWRTVAVATLSPIMAYYTPTGDFLLALVVLFAFNVWAGMRADGVSVKRCSNFSFSKVWQALAELGLYVTITLVIYTFMASVGDQAAGLVVVKSLSYIFGYFYAQNALKNLIHAYPHTTSLRVVYHLLRLELARAAPTRVREVIERVERESKAKEADNQNNTNNCTDGNN